MASQTKEIDKNITMSFRYFVIGSGSIGKRHAENLITLGAKVTHLAWRGIDLPKLMSDIESCKGRAGVVIATATKVRVPLITKCAEAGAALYIEKPVAYRSSDIKAIYALPHAALKRSVAGFMMRYHPTVKKLLRKPVNNIFRAYFEIGHDVKKWRQNWKFTDSYAADLEGGGVLLDLCHEIDLAYLFCGEVPLKSVQSVQHPEFDGVDIATTLDFVSQNGCSYRVAMDYLSPALIRRGSIIGRDEQVDYDIANHYIKYVTENESLLENIEQERNQTFLDLMTDFILLAEGKKTKNPYIPRLDRVKNVCHIIARAWETREFIGKFEANLI